MIKHEEKLKQLKANYYMLQRYMEARSKAFSDNFWSFGWPWLGTHVYKMTPTAFDYHSISYGAHAQCAPFDTIRAVGSLVVRASDSRPEGLGSMLDVTKYPPSAHGFTCRNCGGGDRGRVAIYRPFGEVSLSLNRTVTCMVLNANDRRTSCPCHDEFRGPRSDYVRQGERESGVVKLYPQERRKWTVTEARDERVIESEVAEWLVHRASTPQARGSNPSWTRLTQPIISSVDR
ncbi:uncharacterized protein TNCV_1019381 [Trichonephila clavipes]|nr:uncharacterized protein TNCV_1019381 [Trichonephila clavipes]